MNFQQKEKNISKSKTWNSKVLQTTRDILKFREYEDSKYDQPQFTIWESGATFNTAASVAIHLLSLEQQKPTNNLLLLNFLLNRLCVLLFSFRLSSAFLFSTVCTLIYYLHLNFLQFYSFWGFPISLIACFHVFLFSVLAFCSTAKYCSVFKFMVLLVVI